MKYVIERRSWFNEYGKESNISFVIKHRKSFLGLFSYWKYETHKEGYMGDVWNERTSFKTELEATTFAKELCNGLIRDAHKSTIVKEVTCK